MANVEGVIDAAIDRANYFADMTDSAVRAISTATDNSVFTVNDLDIKETAFNAVLEKPEKDKTPMPVYEAPAVDLPDDLVLVKLHGVDEPILPDDVPEIDTSGLFKQKTPSDVIPDWNEKAPILHADEIYNEMAALPDPVLTDVNIPSITPISLRTPPSLELPVYEAYATPEAIPETIDYAAYYDAKYNEALPEMQAYIDNVVLRWMDKYAPEFEEQRVLLNAKLIEGLNGTVLPDQIENAMYSRAQGRIEQEFLKTEESIFASAEKSGFLIPSSSVLAARNKARLMADSSLAGSSTDIYIERRKSEVQHLQFVLSLMSQSVQSLRTLATQLATQALEAMRQANAHADAIAAKMIVRFEHERSRREFSLAIMKALNDAYEVKLKAALSGLEGYKLELQALELQANVEMKQIEGAKIQLEAQQLLVTRYSAMIDAIAKRAVGDELKIKEYGIKADVYKMDIQARLATFDVYKAALDGDKAKLQGELAKLEVFNSQIKAANLKLEAQSKVLDADVKTNAALVTQWTGQLDAYKIASQVALQKFTAQAELKKMGLEIYKTNLQANLAVYEGEIKEDLAWVTTQIEQYKANVENRISTMKLKQSYVELAVQKAIATASGYSNIASASAQSVSSMASISTTSQ